MSWLPIAPDSDFSLANLPMGIFCTPGLPPRMGVALGSEVVDIAAAVEQGVFPEALAPRYLVEQRSLNPYLAAQRHDGYLLLRAALQTQLTDPESPLRAAADRVFYRQAAVEMLLPVEIPDYTDFYASQTHATNVGRLFRPENPLMSNWKHLPVGYHGRASSIGVSGMPVRRPMGQFRPDPEAAPVFGPSRRLDYELELAAVVDTPNPQGSPVSIAAAESHLFGFLLFNDWSARDIQAWEYQPLGPFLGKNFASTVSPWLVPRIALEPARVAGPFQDPPVLPYLQAAGPAHWDLVLEAHLATDAGDQRLLTHANARDLYWSFAQMVAHHTVNGCNLRVGDILASGTVSSPDPADTGTTYGCLLELTRGGRAPLHLPSGQTRTFLEDGDTVTLRGFTETPAGRVGFGNCQGRIVGAQ